MRVTGKYSIEIFSLNNVFKNVSSSRATGLSIKIVVAPIARGPNS